MSSTPTTAGPSRARTSTTTPAMPYVAPTATSSPDLDDTRPRASNGQASEAGPSTTQATAAQVAEYLAAHGLTATIRANAGRTNAEAAATEHAENSRRNRELEAAILDDREQAEAELAAARRAMAENYARHRASQRSVNSTRRRNTIARTSPLLIDEDTLFAQHPEILNGPPTRARRVRPRSQAPSPELRRVFMLEVREEASHGQQSTGRLEVAVQSHDAALELADHLVYDVAMFGDVETSTLRSRPESGLPSLEATMRDGCRIEIRILEIPLLTSSPQDALAELDEHDEQTARAWRDAERVFRNQRQ